MKMTFDIVKVLSALSMYEWRSFDETKLYIKINRDRLALILIYGARYHVFDYECGNWSISSKYKSKQLNKLLYADLSFDDITLDDLEFYFLTDHISSNIISDKLYDKLEKTKKHNLPNPASKPTPAHVSRPVSEPNSAPVSAPKPDSVQTQTPAQEAKLVITTSHRQRKKPSELFSKNKPKSLSAFYFQKISGHKKAHQSTCHQPTTQQLSAQVNHSAYRGERINNPAIETSRELDRSRRDIEKFKTEPGFNELDRGAMK